MHTLRAQPRRLPRARTRTLALTRVGSRAAETRQMLTPSLFSPVPSHAIAPARRRYNAQINAYHPRPKEWVKTQIFNHLRRQAAS